MELLNRIRNYLLEEEFSIQVYNDHVDILNYERIGHFDHEKVQIFYQKGVLNIKGKNLVVSKLMKDEVLITGVIEVLELK